MCVQTNVAGVVASVRVGRNKRSALRRMEADGNGTGICVAGDGPSSVTLACIFHEGFEVRLRQVTLR